MKGEQAVNIAACLPALAARQPDVTAIFEPIGRDTDGRTRYREISYRQLDVQSEEIARGLEAVGIGRGVRTVLMVPPGADFFALAFGMARAGVVPVVVDPGMPRAGLKACLSEAQPEAFIGIAKAHAARLALGWARETVRHKVTVGGRALLGGLTLEQVRSAGQGRRGNALAPTRAEDVAAILFTSGSTGRPKGAVYTHGNFVAQVEALRRVSGIGAGERDLPTFAPFALFDPALGMSTVLPEMDFARPAAADPARLVEAITRLGVTNLFCSPALLGVLARWAVPRGVTLPSLRRVVSAGAPVSPKWVERFTQLLAPDAQVLTPYGATEALPVAVIGSREILSHASATAAGAGVCVGRPVEGVEVAIVPISEEPWPRWSEARRRPTGEIGEIAVRGAMVTRSYWNRPQDTSLAKMIDAQGEVWHRMGDLGYLDSEGRLWFCGRKSQRVVLGGGPTLYTIPCEAVFNAHPQVRRTALVGPRREGKVVPVLCVEPEPAVSSASREQLTRELLALGARHPHCAPVKTILFHPGFPVDTRHNAKIGREALAQWAEGRLR